MSATKRILITRQHRTSRVDFSKPTNSKPKNESQEKFGGPNPLPPSFGGEGGFVRHAETANEKVNKVDELLNQARQLTAKERQELLDQLSLVNKISKSADQDRDLDMWVVAVHTALVDVSATSDGSAYGKLLIKQLLATSQAWRPIEDFMRQSRLNELKVVERASVYHMLADLLVKHASKVAERSGAPLGPKLVGNCTSGIASVFDQAFPGYLRAGLAKIAARQLVSVRA